MSKHVETPTSRLICFGGAKAATHACLCPDPVEDSIALGFMD